MSFRRTALAGVFIWFILCIQFICAAELTVVCTSDLHGHFEKIPQLAPLIRACGKNALKIDTGDTLTGTLFSDAAAGKPVIDLLNRLSFDIWVPGNHDFETGYDALSARIREFRGVTMGVQWCWRDIVPVKWKLFERGGVRAAVIGATDPAMPMRILPGVDGQFSDLVYAIKEIMPSVRAARPDVIILALHNGLYSKRGNPFTLSWYFPEIDLILGGHTHKEIAGYRMRNCYFVQAGCHGSCIARVRILVDDKTRRIKKIESALLHPDAERIDRTLAKLCKKWQIRQKQLAVQKICKLPERSISGTFFADALRRAAKADGAVAVFSGKLFAQRSRRRTGTDSLLFPRCVTGEVLYQLVPFRNRVCTITVTRQDLAELSENFRMRRKKYRQRFFFSGDIHMDSRGEIRITRDRITLAVTDYILCSTPALQRKLENVPQCWRIVENVFERELFRSALAGFYGIPENAPQASADRMPQTP